MDHGLTERFYEKLLLIRRMEERVADVYPTDKVKSPIHLSIGQEAVSVGVCEALEVRDAVFGTYRGHALYLARGGDPNAMAAELFGKETGCGRGKAGSMHLGHPDINMPVTSAIVATGIPNAMGWAFAQKYRGEDAITVNFHGEGAVDEGVWSESLNFAALKSLPILFVVENNDLAIHSRQKTRMAGEGIVGRARALGVPGLRVESGDAFDVYDAARGLVSQIRGGGGPRLLEADCYRWREHVGPGEDWRLGYRGRSEMAPWVENDSLVRVAAMVDDAAREAIERKVAAALDDAFDFAERSPFPSAEELEAHF